MTLAKRLEIESFLENVGSRKQLVMLKFIGNSLLLLEMSLMRYA